MPLEVGRGELVSGINIPCHFWLNLRGTECIDHWEGDKCLIILPEVSSEDASRLTVILCQSIKVVNYDNRVQLIVSHSATVYFERDMPESISERAD